MAQAYVRGPAHIFAGVGMAGTPFYLGTAERTPKIQIRRAFSPVWNDLGGQLVPYDWCYEGQEGFVVADLTRWNQPVLAALQGAPRQTIAAATPGTDVVGDIGTLMVTEGAAIPLWIMFPYTAKAAFAAQPAGYHFLATWLLGPDDLDENNTKNAKVRLSWYCGRAGLISQAPIPGIAWALYDFNLAGMPPID